MGMQTERTRGESFSKQSEKVFSLDLSNDTFTQSACLPLSLSLSLSIPLCLCVYAALRLKESEKSLHNNNEMLALKYSSYATLYKLHML